MTETKRNPRRKITAAKPTKQQAEQAAKPAERVLRVNEVSHRLGLAKSTIWHRLNPYSHCFDKDFPRPFKISGKGNSVGWLESEINAYITKQASTRL